MKAKLIKYAILVILCAVGFLYFVGIDSTSRNDEVRKGMEENFPKENTGIIKE